MKKEILVVISVALVVVTVGCGLWLGWYALDSHHQKEAFAGLSQEFVLEAVSYTHLDVYKRQAGGQPEQQLVVHCGPVQQQGPQERQPGAPGHLRGGEDLYLSLIHI